MGQSGAQAALLPLHMCHPPHLPLPQGPDFGDWTASKRAQACDGIALRRQGSLLQVRFLCAAREGGSQDGDLQGSGAAAGGAGMRHGPDAGGGANSGGANSQGSWRPDPGADATLEEGLAGPAAGAAAAAEAVGEPAAAQHVGKLRPEYARQHNVEEDAELRDEEERLQQRHGRREHTSRKRQRADVAAEAAARATSGGATAAAAAAGATQPAAADSAIHSAIAARLAVGGAGGTGQTAAAADTGGAAWAAGQAAEAAPLPAAGAALEPKPPGKCTKQTCVGGLARSGSTRAAHVYICSVVQCPQVSQQHVLIW